MKSLMTSYRPRGAGQTVWTVAATLLLGSLFVLFSSGDDVSEGRAMSAPQEPAEVCPIARTRTEPPCSEAAAEEELLPPTPC